MVSGTPLRTHVDVRGDGQPLVFLHGFPLDHTMWEHQLGAFAGTYRVIAPDLPGFGQSPLSHGTNVLSMEQMADLVNGLLDDLKISQPIVLCGLSMGGYVAFEFVRKYRARLAGLILCDTRAAADTAEAAAGRRATAERVLTEGPRAIAETMIAKIFGPGTIQDHPDVIDKTRQVILNTPAATIAAALLGMAERRDNTVLLSSLDVPTLAVVGEDDALTPPEEMRRMAISIPGAAFVEVPGAGHMAPLERPNAVSDVIRTFLAKLPASH